MIITIYKIIYEYYTYQNTNQIIIIIKNNTVVNYGKLNNNHNPINKYYNIVKYNYYIVGIGK